MFFLFITGGGGTGKSFLIHVIHKWTEKILRSPGDHPDKPKTLILAPTGVAACLIGNIPVYILCLHISNQFCM